MAKTQRGSKLLVFYRLPILRNRSKHEDVEVKGNSETETRSTASDKPNQNHLYSVH